MTSTLVDKAILIPKINDSSAFGMVLRLSFFILFNQGN